jgi:serine/threonine protein kinase
VRSTHFLALNLDTHRSLVLKCCFVTLENEDLIANEANLMRDSSSIWTVPLLDSFRDSDFYYLAMPYFRVSWDAIDQESFRCELCWDVINALAHLHSMGIWHRDVNKENVFLSAEQVPDCEDYVVYAFLGDFGLAHKNEVGVGLPLGAGTSGYLAPELVRGEICWFVF